MAGGDVGWGDGGGFFMGFGGVGGRLSRALDPLMTTLSLSLSLSLTCRPAYDSATVNRFPSHVRPPPSALQGASSLVCFVLVSGSRNTVPIASCHAAASAAPGTLSASASGIVPAHSLVAPNKKPPRAPFDPPSGPPSDPSSEPPPDERASSRSSAPKRGAVGHATAALTSRPPSTRPRPIA